MTKNERFDRLLKAMAEGEPPKGRKKPSEQADPQRGPQKNCTER